MNTFSSTSCPLLEFASNLKLNWFTALPDYVFCHWPERKLWVWFCDNPP